MGKQRDFFSFRCPYSAGELRERLTREVKRLTDREYLLEETARGFDLGIGRGNHCCGYWYSASVEPDGDGCRITGKVEYRDWNGMEIRVTWVDKIEFAFLFLILFPIVSPYRIYRWFRPEVTMEERFVEFMSRQLDCELME